ncbi:unnamed protein product [Euphydryas editha]|uniref:DUF7869 domain-containing protein n=1 Tax=Euphydryas editha TaxID=104508 RepID=A0AAU9TDE6_EUPED|nr:unnamed protein product [Euphydryas editha]
MKTNPCANNKCSNRCGFHIPKKDKCVLCSKRNYDGPTEEETYKMNPHIKEKEDCYKRCISVVFQQNLSKKDKTVICAIFDLQGKNMSLYYSRKISVYNFTIYESGTQEGFCHIWNETDAYRGANEIATILLSYIKQVDSRGYVNTLLLYADSCYGQNKNKTMLSMLRYALAKTRNIKVIQINYLVPGHTYMPVDSMHAVIERSIKDTMIWAPSHWPTAIALARKNPFPYKVTLMEGKDFMGFEDIINKTFKKTQKLMISTISVATFKKKNLTKWLSPKKKLYPYKLPISAQKYADLKKLTKQVIPAAYANEYLNLKYSNKNVDHLPESDEDDSA